MGVAIYLFFCRGEPMKKITKKYFWFVSALGIFGFGMVLALSYRLSEGAAWSLLVSSIRETPWECMKPFAIVSILWVFIELSCLRPSLLRFVSSKIIFLHFFAWGTFLILTLILKFLPFTDYWYDWYGIVFLMLLLSEVLSYRLYESSKKYEKYDWLFLPLMVSFVIFFFMILLFSVHPPKWIL